MERSWLISLTLLCLAGLATSARAQYGPTPPADLPPTGGVVRPTAPSAPSGAFTGPAPAPAPDHHIPPIGGDVRRPFAPPPRAIPSDLHPCPPKGCPCNKVCVPDVKTTTEIDVCYGVKCHTVCLPICKGWLKKCCCCDAAGPCGKVREVRVLMKRFVPRQSCIPVCVPVEVPTCPAPCCPAPCGAACPPDGCAAGKAAAAQPPAPATHPATGRPTQLPLGPEIR